MKSAVYLNLGPATKQTVFIDGIKQMVVGISDLIIQASFGFVINFAVDLLSGRAFIDRCTSDVFPSKRDIVP